MRHGEKGFTLLEVLVTMAIIGIIMPMLTMSVITMMKLHVQANEQNIVLQQVQNTGYWISRDVQMAGSITLNAPNGFPISLEIPVDTDANNDYSVDYLFDGNKLKRQVYNSSHVLVSESLIAEYIDAADTTFINLAPSTYFLTVKSSKGENSTERSYRVSQRLTTS